MVPKLFDEQLGAHLSEWETGLFRSILVWVDRRRLRARRHIPAAIFRTLVLVLLLFGVTFAAKP